MEVMLEVEGSRNCGRVATPQSLSHKDCLQFCYGISPRRCSDSVMVFGSNMPFSTGSE